MANIQNGSKMMGLLKSSSSLAQIRHIAKRASGQPAEWGKLSKDQLDKELKKAENYKVNKRRSLYEQRYGDEKKEVPNRRMDDIYYKHKDVLNRQYTSTWNSFPEHKMPPARRRSRSKEPTE